MLIYQYVENTCIKFENINNWYTYPWHSDANGTIFPGKVIKYIMDITSEFGSFQNFNDDKQKNITNLTRKIFRKEYDKVELSCIKFENLLDYPIPPINLDNKDEICDILELPMESIKYEMLELIEAAIVGYLINKKIKVHGIVYGSKFHNIIGNFVND